MPFVAKTMMKMMKRSTTKLKKRKNRMNQRISFEIETSFSYFTKLCNSANLLFQNINHDIKSGRLGHAISCLTIAMMIYVFKSLYKSLLTSSSGDQLYVLFYDTELGTVHRTKRPQPQPPSDGYHFYYSRKRG